MKCIRCNKEMDKAAAWIGGYPVGPKCLEKMHGPSLSIKYKTIRNEQSDLFQQDDEIGQEDGARGVSMPHEGVC